MLQQSQNFMPQTLGEMMDFSSFLSKSNLVPKELRGNPADIFLCLQAGSQLGLSTLDSLQSIMVVNGRATIWGDAALALVRASGLMTYFHEEGNEKYATCTARRGDEERTHSFTMADAVKAGLVSRNPLYNKFPRRLLQSKPRSWVLRDLFPDVLKGIHIREEVEDYEDLSKQQQKIKNNQLNLLKDALKENIEDAIVHEVDRKDMFHEEHIDKEESNESIDLSIKLKEMIIDHKVPDDVVRKWLSDRNVKSVDEFSDVQIAKAMEKIETAYPLEQYTN